MIINPYIFGGWDIDALAFITASGITDSTQKSAINTLVLDLKSSNVWNKMTAIYPFVGGTAFTHRWNLKDPRDLDVAYRLVFSGGWTHSSTGARPNGTDGYAITKIVPSVVYGTNNPLLHFSMYNRTNLTITSSVWADGVYSSNGIGGNCFMQVAFTTLVTGNSTTTLGSSDPIGTLNGFSNNTDGYFVFSRTSNTSLKAYRNGSLVGTNTNNIGSDTYVPRTDFLLGARNDSFDLQLRPNLYNNIEKAFATIGTALTDTEANDLRIAVQKFNTTLGRQI